MSKSMQDQLLGIREAINKTTQAAPRQDSPRLDIGGHKDHEASVHEVLDVVEVEAHVHGTRAPQYGQRNVQPRKRAVEEVHSKAAVAKISHGNVTTGVPLTEPERRKIVDQINQFQQAGVAKEWAGTFAQAAGGLLAVAGAIAMTWAMVQGVRSASRG